jgi:hypothetical protein
MIGTGIALTGRAGMYHIKPVEGKSERIGLDEVKGIMWLRGKINSHHFKSGASIANGAATSAAEEVK